MTFRIPLIIRGRVIEAVDGDPVFGGRNDGISFTTPDVKAHLSELILGSPRDLADFHALPMQEIFDYLHELGQHLSLDTNPHMQEAFEHSVGASGLTREIVHYFYSTLGRHFDRRMVRDMTEHAIGVDYLDGWVEKRLANGCVAQVRAFGARAVHVLAGNVPVPSAFGVIRNAVTRSDAIFKAPSNDPITAAAIARTMIDFAPDHPVTKHLSVAYWKGGDAGVEDYLYQPQHIEKILAWGGQASVMHIAKYIQPGIDLVTLDPKLSMSIVGKAGFETPQVMREVAHRIALDVGYFNQQACSNARVLYVETGTDDDGLARANQLGQMVYEELQSLPRFASGPAERLDKALDDELRALRMTSHFHKIIGGGPEGAIIVSQSDEPVDFAPMLNQRVANLVPVDDLDTAISSVTSYTQTIGVYPDTLKPQIRDQVVFQGAQRLTSLGFACKGAQAGPHDGIEPLRRMCKWIVDETNDLAEVALLSAA